MSAGGVLVVLDRLGREVKKYPLPSGIATIGSALTCNIKIIQNDVSSHHATVIVRNNQTVVRSIGGTTLVNNRAVSVAALQHHDEITVGSRRLRWHYSAPHIVPEPLRLPELKLEAMSVERRRGRGSLRGPARLAEAPLRASLPASMPTTASSGNKQVAIVQPQRRDTTQHNDASPRLTVQPHRPYGQVHNRQRASHSRTADISSASVVFEDRSKRKSNSRSPRTPEPSLQNTTKATLWIESRKPRKIVRTPASVQLATHSQGQRQTVSVQRSTPLRMVVLRRTMTPTVRRNPAVTRKVQSEVKTRVTKIQAPLKLDYMKQAAINLMMGHTPKTKLSGKQDVVVTTASLSFPTMTAKKNVKRRSLGNINTEATRERASSRSSNISNRKSKRSQGNHISVIHIEDSNTRIGLENESLNTTANTMLSSPQKSPKKSALKASDAKSTRKIESIKFDLSNLEDDTNNDTVLSNNTRDQSSRNSASKSNFSLDYSDTLQSPSPRKSINSRSSRILQQSLGLPVNMSQSASLYTLTPQSPRSRSSSRSRLVVQKALGTSKRESKRSARLSYISGTDTITSTNMRKSNPRKRNLETYSIVDLVSVDSQSTKTCSDSGNSYTLYDSAESSATFGTPLKNVSRATRSTIDPASVISSTPYVDRSRRSQRSRSNRDSNQNNSLANNQTFNVSTRSSASRRSKNLTTPDNETEFQPVMRVRASRSSKSRSRLNDSSLQSLQSSPTAADDGTSPITSRRTTASRSKDHSTVDSITSTPENSPTKGMITPETRQSPQDVGTPILSIQNLLDSSITSVSSKKKNISKRQTFAGAGSRPKRRLGSALSKSLPARGSPGGGHGNTAPPQANKSVTPTTSAPLLQEPIRNKHSTAKKNQSKRGLIDNLNESEFVKKLFDSPVKRKLSQSMIEFSKKHELEDDVPRKRTRNTVADMRGGTPVCTEDISEDISFVSLKETPNKSPKLTGNKKLLRTPRPRKSPRNDLTNVSRIKALFATSPKNSLGDVQGVKYLYRAMPRDELINVEGVKPLFERRSPRNDLTDVRGVKGLFTRSKRPRNLTPELISGVRKIIQTRSPRNRLSDVRGVKKLFEKQRRDNLSDVSGVKQLFYDSATSHTDADEISDQSKSHVNKSKQNNRKSRESFSVNKTKLIDKRIQEGLQNRTQTPTEQSNTSRTARELKKLNIDTVRGSPFVHSRTRNAQTSMENLSSVSRRKTPSEVYSARKLPLKKRSLANASGQGNASSSASSRLPFKKRAPLPTSTPIKGAVDVTCSAELGRVSPIQPRVSCTGVKAEEVTEIKSRRSKIGKKETNTVSTTLIQTRGVISKDVTITETVTSKKRRLSFVVNQKQIVLKPQSIKDEGSVIHNNKKTEKSNTPIETSPIKRVTRRRVTATQPALNKKSKSKSKENNGTNKDDKPQTSTANNKAVNNKKVSSTKKSPVEVRRSPTPKKTRAKVRRGSLIITKLSPEMKPQALRTRGKKADINATTESKTKNQPSPKKTRSKANQKSNLVIPKTPPKAKPQVKRTRGKNKPIEIEPQTVVTPRRPTRARKQTAQESKKNNSKHIELQTVVTPIKPTRARKQTAQESKKNISKHVELQTVVTPIKPTRARKQTAQESKKNNSKQIEPQTVVTPKRPTRARKQTAQESKQNDSKKKGTYAIKTDEVKVTSRNIRNKLATTSHTDSITKVSKNTSTDKKVANKTKNVEKAVPRQKNKDENASKTSKKNFTNKTETEPKTENDSKSVENKPVTRRRKMEDAVENKPKSQIKGKILQRKAVKESPEDTVVITGGRNVAKKASVQSAPAAPAALGRKRKYLETSVQAEASAAPGPSKSRKMSSAPPSRASARTRQLQLADESAASTSRPRRR